MDILESYLKKNGCKIFKGEEALEIYRNNRGSFEEICGSAIYDTLDGFMDNDDEDDDIKLIIVNSKEKPNLHPIHFKRSGSNRGQRCKCSNIWWRALANHKRTKG